MKKISIFTVILVLSSCQLPQSSSLESSPSNATSMVTSERSDSSTVSNESESSQTTETSSSLKETSIGPSSLASFEYTYTASPGPDEMFMYWRHVATGKLLSKETPFTTLVETSEDIEAVYRHVGEYFYSTQFETGKSSYARAPLVLDNKAWMFEDAVTGNLSGDKVVTGRAARLHGGGSIATTFDVGLISDITMQTAVYGSDTPNAKLNLMYSQDQLTWFSLAEYTPTSTLSIFHVEIDWLSLYLEETYDPSLPMYVKILNMNHATPLDGVRINVDSLVINTIQEPFTFPVLNHQNHTISFAYSASLPEVIEVDSAFTLPSCLATDTVTLTTLPCEVSGNVDVSTVGQYSLVYSMVDTYGYTIEDRYQVTVLENLDLLQHDYEGFYDGLEGLYGTSLLLGLRAKGWDAKTNQPYSEGKTVLPISDANPNVAGEAIAIYTGNSLSSVWDEGTSWQREHVWPNSRLGVRRVGENDANIASDLHNLRFIESSINASRSNKWFDGQTTDSTYNPGNDAGDVARILLYMVVMYDHLSLSNTPVDDQVYMVQGAQLGKLDFLLTALQTDPVSAFEVTRNSVLQTRQGNPNPFIDYPQFANLLFF